MSRQAEIPDDLESGELDPLNRDADESSSLTHPEFAHQPRTYDIS